MSLFDKSILLCGLLLLSFNSLLFAAEKEPLRILTWEGYVTPEELVEVNQLLESKGYAYEAKMITPYAEGAKQMFDLIREGKCDITFLTLFFIKMEQERTDKVLQSININSPRLTNYKYLHSSLTHIPMGLNEEGAPLYIPWGGGIYGFYVDKNRVAASAIPKSVNQLWEAEWKNRFSLNESQEWYNIGLALMSMGESPFYLYRLVQEGDRETLSNIISNSGKLQKRVSQLYANAGHFWTASPEFKDNLQIVSSWGPEIVRENKKGANWEMVNFKEGHMVWLDTINFVKNLEGRKLEAAEIFANYYIGKKIQSRVARELSMVAASKKVEINTLLGDPAEIFKEHMFVPPFDRASFIIMKRLINRARLEMASKYEE